MTNLSDENSTQFFSSGIAYGDGKIKNEWVEPHVLVPKGEGLILDLGCGEGETMEMFRNRGYQWIGLDIRKTKGVSVVGDAHNLPFRTAAFSTVYSRQVFEHLLRPWAAASEVFRVMKPTGSFFGSMSCLEPFHNSYFNYTHWGVEEVLRQAGFVPIRIEAGASAFLVLLHHMVDGAGPWFSTPIARFTIKPMIWFLKVLGKTFIFFRYGRSSYQMKKIDEYFSKFALRFAGHIQFAAEKSAAE